MRYSRVATLFLVAGALMGMTTPCMAHQVPCDASKATATPAPTIGQFVVTAAEFNKMFPYRDKFYTYESLAAAAKTFKGFTTVGDLAMRKREAAAALANFSQETGRFKYIQDESRGSYCDVDVRDTAICAPGKEYYGRGPGLLAWSSQYRRASFELFGNARLSADPDLVARNPVTAWRTGIWRWMTIPQKEGIWFSAHDAITTNFGLTQSGFGAAINAFTWGWECRPMNPNHPSMQKRVDYFLEFTGILRTVPGGPNEC